MNLKPGQQAQVGDFTVRLNAVKVTDDGQKQMITARHDGAARRQEIARMYPARWFYRKHEEEPTTEVAIRRGFAEDLYLVMPAFSVEEQSASMGIHVNPLVNWVWAGFGVLAIGTGVALLPGHGLHVRAREPAGRRRDRVDAAARAGAVALDAARAADGAGHAEERAPEADRRRDPLHVRLP